MDFLQVSFEYGLFHRYWMVSTYRKIAEDTHFDIATL